MVVEGYQGLRQEVRAALGFRVRLEYRLGSGEDAYAIRELWTVQLSNGNLPVYLFSAFFALSLES